MISRERASGPSPIFSLGDDLAAKLPVPEADRPRQALRADLILSAMGKLHYDGLVVGERDLAFGLAKLRSAAAEQHLPLLSANLAPVTGDNPFVGHVVTKAGALTICAAAVNGAQDYGPEVTRTDAKEAAARELASFATQGCDLKILLAHMERSELDAILRVVPGYDAAFFGHQGQQFAPQRADEATVFGDGQKGRAVGIARFGVAEGTEGGAKSGPLADRGEADRIRDNEKTLEKQIAELKKRLETAPESQKAGSQRSIDQLKSRLADAKEKLPKAEHKRDPKVYSFEWASLGTDVADDPELKAEVDAFASAHPEPPPVLPLQRPVRMQLPDGGTVPLPPLPPPGAPYGWKPPIRPPIGSPIGSRSGPSIVSPGVPAAHR